MVVERMEPAQICRMAVEVEDRCFFETCEPNTLSHLQPWRYFLYNHYHIHSGKGTAGLEFLASSSLV